LSHSDNSCNGLVLDRRIPLGFNDVNHICFRESKSKPVSACQRRTLD
jgi:hypothetical protein